MPNNLLSEQAVLKKLNARDFYDVPNDKIVDFVSMLDKMPNEVALKGFDQIPGLISGAKELFSSCKDVAALAIESNDNSAQQCYDTCDQMQALLSGEIKREEFTPDQKLDILNLLFECAKLKFEVHKENQEFKLKALKIFGWMTIGVGFGLGLLHSLSKNNSDSKEEETDEYID